MNKLLPILFLFAACAADPKKNDKVSDEFIMDTVRSKDLSDPTNTLSGKTEVLELEYIDFMCDCAKWITLADHKKYKDTSFSKHCIFIEPANDSLTLPAYFDHFRHKVKVKGQFYVKPDYPKGTKETEEKYNKAPVFRYSEMLVLNNDYRGDKDTTLNLSYNAIACTCAQWSDTNPAGNTPGYFYLEPGNDKLTRADTLYDGNNLPVSIQVSGRVVSESGYPIGFAPTKGNPKPAKVFRYTSLKIIKRGKRKQY